MSLPRIPCPQALGEIPYDPQSKKDQRAYQTRPLQNGNAQIHPRPPQTGGLDRVHRPEGCLSPRPYRTPASRDLLGFTVAGGTYRFKALPFGLRPAPRLFTRLVACVAAFLRQRGLRLFCYLDDWLLAAESRDVLYRQLHFLLQTVQALGFLVYWKKSELAPTRRPTFLGAAIDLPRQLARPRPERVNTIMAAASRLRRRRQAPARVWLQFLGYLTSLVVVLPDCRLHMRPLQIHLLRHYSPSRDLLTRLVPIHPTIRLHLVRWSRRDFLNSGNPLRVAQSSITVTTDASRLGWGGHCLGNAAFGDWPRADTLSHINVLEFLGCPSVIRTSRPLLRRRRTVLDWHPPPHVTLAAYINKQGGIAAPPVNALAALLWKGCRRERIFPIDVLHPGTMSLPRMVLVTW